MKLEIFTDGACLGNHGPAGIGVVIRHNGAVIKEISKPIGQATNNIAEYTALIYALQEALILKAEEVLAKADSQLMCEQIAGTYAVRQAHIKPLFEQVKRLAMGFKRFRLEHVPREKNAEADRLSRKAVKNGKQSDQDGRPAAAGSGEESPSSKG